VGPGRPTGHNRTVAAYHFGGDGRRGRHGLATCVRGLNDRLGAKWHHRLCHGRWRGEKNEFRRSRRWRLGAASACCREQRQDEKVSEGEEASQQSTHVTSGKPKIDFAEQQLPSEDMLLVYCFANTLASGNARCGLRAAPAIMLRQALERAPCCCSYDRHTA